jgi:hypothetical protein
MRRSTEMNPSEMTIENLADGTVRVTITGPLPAASIAENPKWPFTPWNVAYQQKMVQKDAPRVLQSVANLRYAEGVVAARAAKREEEKAAKAPQALVAAAAQTQQPAQPTVEVAAPAPSSTPAPKASTKKSRKERS